MVGNSQAAATNTFPSPCRQVDTQECGHVVICAIEKTNTYKWAHKCVNVRVELLNPSISWNTFHTNFYSFGDFCISVLIGVYRSVYIMAQKLPAA